MPAEGMRPEYLELLMQLERHGGQMRWAELIADLRWSERSLKSAISDMIEDGCVEPVQKSAERPTVRLSWEGRELLSNRLSRSPIRSCIVRVRTPSGAVPGAQLEILIDSADGSPQLVSRIDVDSHRLAAVRYFLLWAPGALTAELLDSACSEIGYSLLPHCVLPCAASDDKDPSSCSKCVRGRVIGHLQAASSRQYIRLILDVEPPWTYVPWELAAPHPGWSLALDPRISMVRSRCVTSDTLSRGGVFRVLIVLSAAGDDPAALLAEVARLSETLKAERDVEIAVMPSFATAADIKLQVDHFRPTAVYLLAHGSPSGVVASDGTVVDSGSVASAFSGAGIEIAVLGTCFGGSAFSGQRAADSLISRVGAVGIDWVIGFEGQARGRSIELFVTTFLSCVTRGHGVERSVYLARGAITGTTREWGQVVLVRAGASSDQAPVAG